MKNIKENFEKTLKKMAQQFLFISNKINQTVSTSIVLPKKNLSNKT